MKKEKTELTFFEVDSKFLNGNSHSHSQTIVAPNERIQPREPREPGARMNRAVTCNCAAQRGKHRNIPTYHQAIVRADTTSFLSIACSMEGVGEPPMAVFQRELQRQEFSSGNNRHNIDGENPLEFTAEK